jgi:putative PIN family toxin of toxin-antitoxin system
MSRARYVFDTNTLISALLFEQSVPGRAFRKALQFGEVLLSPETLAELSDVLSRKKFERYVTPTERETFLAALVHRAVLLEPSETVRACRDPNDDKFLALAVEGGAAYIVTGDDDLLVLKTFRGVDIITAATCLSR